MSLSLFKSTYLLTRTYFKRTSLKSNDNNTCQELCTDFALCCALLGCPIGHLTCFRRDYFTGTLTIYKCPIVRKEMLNQPYQTVNSFRPLEAYMRHCFRYWFVACPGPSHYLINAAILFIGPLGTNFSVILLELYIFSFKKCISKCRLENGGLLVSASMC